MAYQRVKQPKISDVIMEQLEAMILEGSIKPKKKLPP
ncbi:MAG: GntR family transcriptional regulator, partial [Gammaproteobacteria bacterium]|nr:GntR family transcriptional regulator [Gammaproteobacteria bacterium]